MAFCKNCGATMQDGARFCPSCGSDGSPRPVQQGYAQQGYSGGPAATSPVQDAANNKAMGILSYLGILVLVPLFAAKESRFARYHANQGIVLAIAEVAYGIAISILNAIFLAISWRIAMVLSTIFGILWLVFLALSIIGIMNAANGKTKPLPIIGGITILK